MRVRTFALPMRVRSRGLVVREGLLVAPGADAGTGEEHSGQSGWREFSPFTDYPPWMDGRWWRACVEDRDTWPAPVRSSVPVAVNVPAVPADAARALVAASRGCTTAKVKVGTGEADDLARVEAVREALGPLGSIRLAVTGLWTRDDAVPMVRRLARFGLEFVEQPCASLEDCAYVRRRTGVAVAVDESIRLCRDQSELGRIRDYADIAIVKVHPLGGVRAALAVAERVGLPVLVSSTLETSVGIRAGLALAAALPELPYACGLHPASLFAVNVVAEPLTVLDGLVAVPGPDALLTLTDAPGLSPERQRWWLRRLMRAMTIAGDQPPAAVSWEQFQ
jgi:o-succinylbenzoate synthase